MKKLTIALLTVLTLSTIPGLMAHCEIPCGIYGDETRIKLLNEHIATIEKSMNEILKLGKAKDINYNQLVRWINNKEDHANKFQKIVTQYFMTQRIKPGQPEYVKKTKATARNADLRDEKQADYRFEKHRKAKVTGCRFREDLSPQKA